ncbi:hypothetical protein RJ641_006489 [Dillenia turbinata]|uniref:Uncharacterized protein n=1 Tax=Dillenia turbinata TaxID=194707 RepID=A0AAN8VHT5_9MAGN
MASCISACSCLTALSIRQKTHRSLQVKAQSFKDETRSSPLIDENLSMSRGRIEGGVWNADMGGIMHLCMITRTRERENCQELFERLCLACGTIGFTFFGGTVFLCLLSLLYHLKFVSF